MKEICQLDSNLLVQWIEALSSFLNVQNSRFFASVIRNSRNKSEARRWSLKDEVLALSLLKQVVICGSMDLWKQDLWCHKWLRQSYL